MLKIGSISTNKDGSKTIYVDYNDKTKKVICTLFKWKNLTQKRLLKLLLGTMDYKRTTDSKFGLDTEDGLNAHLMITHHKAFNNVKVERVKKYRQTKEDKECIANASDWLCRLYGEKIEKINLPTINFSLALQRSEYNNKLGINISKGYNGKKHSPFIWNVYKNNPTALSSGDGIECSEEEYTTLTLIHELTHHLQEASGNKLEEAEPTINEIEYCNVNYPHLFEKLEKIELRQKEI